MTVKDETEVLIRILADTTPVPAAQWTEAAKAASNGDFLSHLVEKKKFTQAQAEKYRQRVKEVIDAPEIPNWVIIRKLGQGGMGAVYKAVHCVLAKKIVAMKVLAPHLAKDQEFAARFEREAKTAGALDHPNVVRGEDFGKTADGMPYFAMEFVDGFSVKDLLEKTPQLKVGDALKIVRDVALALVHAAENKMVHRDIKPDNIMITRAEGIVKLADLGLAKQTDEENSMTQTGSGFGTPYYMPPEQARNAKYVDARSDIYALGATLYHVLTGKVPFEGDTAIEVLIKKQKGTYPKASAANAEVTSQVNLLIDKMMAVDPAHRFQSAQELVEQLDRLDLHTDELSFIEGGANGLATTPRPSSKSVPKASLANPTPNKVKAPPSMDRTEKVNEAPIRSEEYYLRYRDGRGKEVKTHMPKSRVIHMIKTDQLNETVEISTSPKGPFRKLAAFPEFEPFLRGKIAAKKVEQKGGKTAEKMSDLLANFDKAQSRHQLKKSAKNVGFNIVSFIFAAILFVAGCWGIYTYLIKPMAQDNAQKMKQMEEETLRNKEQMGR